MDLNQNYILDQTNDLLLDDNIQSIQNSIKNIILTNPGGRRGNPEFGYGISKYLESQLTDDLLSTIKNGMTEYLNFYETRISISNINILAYKNINSLEITIFYYKKSTPQNIESVNFIVRG